MINKIIDEIKDIWWVLIAWAIIILLFCEFVAPHLTKVQQEQDVINHMPQKNAMVKFARGEKGEYDYYYDPDTKVEYIHSMKSNAFSVILNTDGKPLIYEGDN